MAPAHAKLKKLIRQSPVVLAFSLFALGAQSAPGQAVTSYLPPELLNRSLKPEQSFLQLGMFDLNPHVGASAIYDNNITWRSDTNKQDDFIYVLSPGFDLIKAGNRLGDDSLTTLRATYNPAFIFFTRNKTYNSIDHFAHINGGLNLAKLSISANQDFESSSGNVADIGSRVEQRYYRTAVQVRYNVTEKTSAEIAGSLRINDYERLIDSQEWIEDNSAHYQVTPKVRLGFGVSAGQLRVSRTPDDLSFLIKTGETNDSVQTFVTPSLRAAYRTTEKTDVTLSVGGELRFFEDGRSRFGPVFSLVGTYRPRDTTDVSLEAHRRERNSAVLDGQNYVTTGFGVRVGQRFRERYRASVSFSYDNAEYESAKRGVSANRVDDYFLLRYGVDVILATSWSLGVFHQYRANSSTDGFDFDNHQISVQTVWSY